MPAKMTRYGYHDMPDNYSDVADWDVKAICPGCRRRHYAPREGARVNWQTNPTTGWIADDLCSEYDGIEYIDNRQHEW
jgi:hypothetical protein